MEKLQNRKKYKILQYLPKIQKLHNIYILFTAAPVRITICRKKNEKRLTTKHTNEPRHLIFRTLEDPYYKVQQKKKW